MKATPPPFGAQVVDDISVMLDLQNRQHGKLVCELTSSCAAPATRALFEGLQSAPEPPGEAVRRTLVAMLLYLGHGMDEHLRVRPLPYSTRLSFTSYFILHAIYFVAPESGASRCRGRALAPGALARGQ